MIYLSLRFDDGTISQYTEAFKYMKKYNLRGTIYLIGKYLAVKHSNYLDLRKAKEIQDHGWEIGYHSWSHDPNWLNWVDYEREIEPDILVRNNIKVNSFALPYSIYNQRVLNSLTKRYKTIVGKPSNITFNKINHQTTNIFKTFTITKNTTIDNVVEAINSCNQNPDSNYIILLFHKIVENTDHNDASLWSCSIDFFQKLIEVVYTLQKLNFLKIVTISEEKKLINKFTKQH